MMEPRLSPLAQVSTRAGIGLRAPHHEAVIADRPAVGWFEIHPENYLGGGAPLRSLVAVRRDWPVSLHAVGLSLGSAGGIDSAHLERIARLAARIEPALISEHLAWSVADGAYLNGLLPLPYTEEALGIVVANVHRVQERLGRPVLIENPSVYLRFAESTIPEAEFLAELARRTGCGLLFDVNNLYVNVVNHGGDPRAYMAALPTAAVSELHLAGHVVNEADGNPILIDDHGSPVAGAVWNLYPEAVRRFPQAATLIEWDTDIPALSVLAAEAAKADRVRQQTLGGGRDACAA